MSFKKILVTALTLCLLLMSLGTTVAASGQSVMAKPDPSLIIVSPQLAYISRASTSLSISSSGLATAVGSITGYQGVTDAVYIFLDLQIYSGGSWQTIASWSNSYQTYRGVLSGSIYVSPGSTYRVKGTYYAHSDYIYESIEQNSQSAYYA